MKKAIIYFICLALLLAFPVPASAEEVTEATVPVTLTVINTVHPISVTVPAALPVSVVDGYTVTANNACISNNAEGGAVQVMAVSVQSGSFTIDSFENFSAKDKTIALKINGCATEYAGPLTISQNAFPPVKAGENLPINYSAKVATSEETSNANVATVIFTIAAVHTVEAEGE